MKLSAKDIADALRVTMETAERIERFQEMLAVDLAERIAQALGGKGNSRKSDANLLTAAQVAKLTGTHVKTVRGWFNGSSSFQVKTVRVGRRRLMRRVDFERQFGEKAAV